VNLLQGIDKLLLTLLCSKRQLYDGCDMATSYKNNYILVCIISGFS